MIELFEDGIIKINDVKYQFDSETLKSIQKHKFIEKTPELFECANKCGVELYVCDEECYYQYCRSLNMSSEEALKATCSELVMKQIME